MHGASVAVLLEATGSVLAVGLNAPQAWRSCRHRLVEGLSPAARWLAVLQSVSWVAFGLSGGGAIQVLTNTVCGVLQAGVLLALLRHAPAARAPRALVPAASASAGWLVCLAAAAGTGLVPVGTLAALCGTASLVPQVVHLATSGGTSARGVSPATVVLTALSSVCWAGYGLLDGHVAVWAPSLLGLAAALVTLRLLGAPGRTHEPAPHGRLVRRPARATAPGRPAGRPRRVQVRPLQRSRPGRTRSRRPAQTAVSTTSTLPRVARL